MNVRKPISILIELLKNGCHMIFFKQKIVIMKRFFFVALVVMKYIDKLKFSICPNLAQGWMELHQYDLGFCWLNLLIYRTPIKENCEERFYMGTCKS